MICNKFGMIFLFATVFMSFNVLCMENNSNCNSPDFVEEKIIIANAKQYFLEFCGENVKLGSKYSCNNCQNSFIEVDEEIFAKKVCQKCAAARLVKILLGNNLQGSFLFKNLFEQGEESDLFYGYEKNLTIETVKKCKYDIINQLVRAYPIFMKLDKKEREELLEVHKKCNYGVMFNYCEN